VNSKGYAITHVGRRRNNEDDFLVDADLGLYVVADGMGGYEGGEIASSLVVQVLHRFFSRVGTDTDAGITRPTSKGRTLAEEMMQLALRQANHEIQKRRVGRLASMGATAAAVLVREDRVLIAHVGDSRVYRLRHDHLVQLTRDHTLHAQLMEAGAVNAAAEANRSTITRAVGVPGAAKPEMRTEMIEPGDKFLLCSDGLSDVVPDWELREILAEDPSARAVEAMVARAYLAGGTDNITALVVETGVEG